LGEGGAKRRVRVRNSLAPTHPWFAEVSNPHPALRADLSQRERGAVRNASVFLKLFNFVYPRVEHREI
jgi:hypothetical protein